MRGSLHDELEDRLRRRTRERLERTREAAPAEARTLPFMTTVTPPQPAHAARRRMLFVSTRYLFPADSGGKIRTSNILRGLKGGAFEVVLASPVPKARLH